MKYNQSTSAVVSQAGRASEKTSFAPENLFQQHRSVSNGFYEWKKLDEKGKKKQAYAIDMADGSPMVTAGLWSSWKNPTSGEEILTCTMMTCVPNKVMDELHDRMPVILAEQDWPKWLGEEPGSEQELLALPEPCPDEALKIWPVDNAVGNVRNKGPQLIAPLAPTLL